LAALKFAGNSLAASEKFRIGKIEIEEQLDRNWEAYQAAWSGNHRRHMRKAIRRANEEGGVELDIRRPTSADEVESLLLEAFEVENRSWKGSERTSVLSNPTVWSFYRGQATAIANEGQLEITFLRHEGKAIAFEYGWHAGGVYYTPKVGYDDAFGRYSPGQLLRVLRYEKAFAGSELQTIDFYGPLAEATAKWATCTYPVSRLVVETGGSGGRALLWAYQNLWGSLRKWRRREEVSNQLEIVQIERKNLAPLPS
jgi:CelD/BcsL family acetyltransferase involved in cellulose biosynthesis